MKWCVTARVSVDVDNWFGSPTNASSPTVLSDSTGRAHLSDHAGYDRSVCPSPSLLASLDFLTVRSCMLVPRDVARGINQIFTAGLAFPFPCGVKPLFVRTGEACCIRKSWDSWRWNSFLLQKKKWISGWKMKEAYSSQTAALKPLYCEDL